MEIIGEKILRIVGYVIFFILIAGVMSYALINEMENSFIAVIISLLWALASTIALWDMLTNHPIIKY